MSYKSSQQYMALKLAALALHLDEAKLGWPVEMHAQAQACVETMYDMVKVLAVWGADEILGPPDGSEKPRQLPKCGAPSGCDGGPGWGAL